MAEDRKPLPFKIADTINASVLSRYNQLAGEASVRIKALLSSNRSFTDDERVLQNMDKALTGGDISIGDTVQVDFPSGSASAEVLSFNAGVLKVKREDGSIRAVSDLSKVVRVTSKADEGAPVYKGYFLPKFGVSIPEGSISHDMESALAPITHQMNQSPLRVNEETWRVNYQRVSETYAELEKRCRDISGDVTFRPNAPRDCVREFGVKRNLPLGRVGASGTPSVDKEVLQSLANLGDLLAPVVIEAREVLSTLGQLEKWQPYAKSGYVQCNWDQFGQPHGRYTSDNPNLQNRVLEVRETIEPRPGYSFVSADWGAAEYVTWASLSKDIRLSKVFQEGADVHAEMGQELQALCPSRVLSEINPRSFGKTINFAILYKMQPWTLAKSLGVQVSEAEDIISSYEERAPQAAEYVETILHQAARNGYVETAFGRRLACPNLRSLKGPAAHQLRKTVWHHHNAGTAAELLKMKMVAVEAALRKSEISVDDAKIVMNMHDEMILEVRDPLVAKVSDIVMAEMKSQIPGFLPFRVDLRVGKSWLAISK